MRQPNDFYYNLVSYNVPMSMHGYLNQMLCMLFIIIVHIMDCYTILDGYIYPLHDEKYAYAKSEESGIDIFSSVLHQINNT